MYTFTCPSCLEKIFSVNSFLPCPVPQPLPEVSFEQARIVNVHGSLKLCKKIRCRCTFSLGDWILSSDSGDYDTWRLSGIWSQEGKFNFVPTPDEDLCALAQENFELKQNLKLRLESISLVLEGLAIQLMDFIFKYFLKMTGKTISLPELNLATTNKLELLSSILAKETEKIRSIERESIHQSKKSIKFN
jgi:hypothetical protein